MTPADPWHDVTAARIPAAGAAALGPVRHRVDVRVFPEGERLWVRWPAGRADVVRCLLPVAGVAFLTPRGGGWFPFGSRLPTADRPPDGDGASVASVLSPARFTPVEAGEIVAPPVVLRAVRGGEPRPATALRCRLADLAEWAESASTAELSAATAARVGGRIVLRGAKLPTVLGATRFWGDDVLVPVGFRADPDLQADVIRAAAGANRDELVLLDETGAEVIPRAVFRPVTRAGLRLAR
ncbi:MAG TPA: hypothetical protein VD866_14700 [Urbifossiella sp.]|nr:hypothetical protein [Urbifossiella sp.]